MKAIFVLFDNKSPSQDKKDLEEKAKLDAGAGRMLTAASGDGDKRG